MQSHPWPYHGADLPAHPASASRSEFTSSREGLIPIRPYTIRTANWITRSIRATEAMRDYQRRLVALQGIDGLLDTPVKVTIKLKAA